VASAETTGDAGVVEHDPSFGVAAQDPGERAVGVGVAVANIPVVDAGEV
jgi:hypothetical protein